MHRNSLDAYRSIDTDKRKDKIIKAFTKSGNKPLSDSQMK